MKKTKHKVLIIIAGFALVAIMLCLVLIKKARQDEPLPAASGVVSDSSTVTNKTVPPSIAETSSGIASESNSSNYYNSDYGFAIYFPQSWGSVEAQEEAASPNREKIIDFNIKTNDSSYGQSGRATIIKLYISTPTQWSSGVVGTKLGENSQYVFSYMIWEEPPSDLQAITEKEISEVLQSFQLTNS